MYVLYTCIACVWLEINLLTSVLGPLLFIIYANDLPDCLDKTKSILFADDATGYISSHNISYLYTTMNDELKKLTDWFRTNKLSLSVSKANYLLFTHQKQQIDTNISLQLSDNIIERTKCVQLLRLHIDEKRKRDEHITIMKNKFSKYFLL